MPENAEPKYMYIVHCSRIGCRCESRVGRSDASPLCKWLWTVRGSEVSLRQGDLFLSHLSIPVLQIIRYRYRWHESCSPTGTVLIIFSACESPEPIEPESLLYRYRAVPVLNIVIAIDTIKKIPETHEHRSGPASTGVFVQLWILK
jgi:hypothetical protein